MPTPAKLAANIANSSRSTGPRTDSGKGRVSENAITHGLTSSRVILPNEDPAEWQAFAAAVVARYNPGTPDEHALAMQIANTEWRLLRAWRAHDHIIGMVTLSLSEAHDTPIEPAAALADQFIDGNDQRRLSLNLRYIRAHERAHQAAVATFTRVKKERLALEAEEAAEEAADEAAEAAEAHSPAARCPATAGAATPNPAVGQQSSPTQPSGGAPQLPRAQRRALERAARKSARKANAGAGSN